MNQKTINRGEQARRIMDQDIVQEAFEALELGIIEGWKEARDEKTRQDAWLMIGLLKDLKKYFRLAIADGKHAKKILKEDKNG